MQNTLRSSNGRNYTITCAYAPSRIARREYPNKLQACLAASQLPGHWIVWSPSGNVFTCLPAYQASLLLEAAA